MWISHMCHNDFFCVGNGSRERLGHYWSPGSHPFGGSRGRPENISMATQLSCARARKSFIQWCSVPRGLHIKSLHHFLVNVCEENNSLLLRVPAQVAGWEHLFAIIAGHGKPPFAVLAFAVRPAAPAECVDASPAPGAQGSPPGMHRPSSNFCPSIRLSPPWLGPSSNFCPSIRLSPPLGSQALDPHK